MGSDSWIMPVAIGAVALTVLYTFVPEFKKAVQGAFGSFGGGTTTTGTCEELCKRRECITYLAKCGPKGCENCSNCAKLCSSVQCTAYKAAGCPATACTNCQQATGVIRQINPNCKTVAGYTIWKGTGCLNGKITSGLEYAAKGATCKQVADQFVLKYKCPSRFTYAYEAPFESVTVA